MKRVPAIVLAILLCLPGIRSEAQRQHRTLIIPLEFNDLKLSTPAESLDSLAAELAKYYDAQFLDSVKFSFDILPTYQVKSSYATFGANQSYRRDANAYRMAISVYKSLYDHTDFSVYDNDGDGNVNDIIFITPGIPESSGGGEDQFWPQYFELESKDIPYSLRYRIVGFATSPELNAEGGLAGIGIMAHEFGHILGLKDFYDTDDDASGGVCPGLGSVSVMDTGLENDSGNTPPNLNAVERDLLGIGRCEILDSTGTFRLEPIHLNGHFYKIPLAVENRYYLLENRVAEGYDAFIGGAGMLVYKIDKSGMDAGWSSYFQRTLTALERWNQNQVNCNPEFPCAGILPARKDSLDRSAIFWPQAEASSFNQGGIAITDIRRCSDGCISFSAFEPVRIESVSIFQSSAILTWTVSEDLGQIDSCKLEWSTATAPVGRVDGVRVGEGRFSYTINGLSPRTGYTYKATVYYSDGTAYSANGSFTTRIYRSGIHPFIYLADTPRGRDGSFRPGTAIPLVVYNIIGEDIFWTFNGTPIQADPDGLWTIPEDGILRAEITHEDGSKDVILKEIRLQ